MPEVEMDAHLDNEKHEKTTDGNYRNEHGTKKIKTSFGKQEIKIPRDRDSSFNPMLGPKRENIAQGIENVIISLYTKEMSVSDIEHQIEVYDFEVSSSTISRITSTITNEVITETPYFRLAPKQLIIPGFTCSAIFGIPFSSIIPDLFLIETIGFIFFTVYILTSFILMTS